MKNNERAERFKRARLVLNKNAVKTLEQVYQDTGIMKSLVSDLENAEKDRGVKYQDIAKLAQYYGVSTDYLLGLTDDYALTIEVKTAAKMTGLSSSSIEYLQNCPYSTIKSMIDILIVDMALREEDKVEDCILNSMWSYVNLKPESEYVSLDRNRCSTRVSAHDRNGNVTLSERRLLVTNADAWDYARAIYEKKMIKVLDAAAKALYQNKADWAIEINKRHKVKKNGITKNAD